jgi:glycosyltransferase involved in cell wall biosynthesis
MSASVSVIMPVHNAEQYVADAISSILGQTLPDLELLIINDGSTDGSRSVISSFNDPRIRYYENPVNLGIIASLNLAFSLVSSPYIARMDADDIALPTRLERQLSYLETHREVDVLGSWVALIGNRGEIRHPIGADECAIHLLIGPSVVHPSLMLRRDSLEAHSLRFDPTALHAEDFQLCVDAVRNGLLIENLPEVLLHYRVHPGQVSSTYESEQMLVRNRIRLAYCDYCFDGLVRGQETTYQQLCEASFPNQEAYSSGKHLARRLVRHNNDRRILEPSVFHRFVESRLDLAAHKLYVELQRDVRLLRALSDSHFYSSTTRRERLTFLRKMLAGQST